VSRKLPCNKTKVLKSKIWAEKQWHDPKQQAGDSIKNSETDGKAEVGS
jgi:hypothetical protein